MSTTEIVTEYGIRQPDGTEKWNENVNVLSSTGFPSQCPISAIHGDTLKRDHFVRQLREIAAAVGIDADAFVASHKLITRQVITITLAPETSKTVLGELPVPF